MKKTFRIFAAAALCALLLIQIPVYAAGASISVSADETVSAFKEKRILQHLSLLPESAEAVLSDAGVFIELSADFSLETKAGERAAAETVLSSDTDGTEIAIYFDADFAVSMGRLILHEAGHAFEYALYMQGVEAGEESPQMLSETDEWLRIYEEDRYRIAAVYPKDAGYAAFDAGELFAEAFMIYILKPDELEAASQEAFLFIENALS